MKALKFATALMGALIVLGTTVLIVTIVHRMGGAKPVPVAAGPAFTASLPGGTGARIAGIAAVDGRLAVWIADGPAGSAGGGRVVLVDPASGKVTGILAPGGNDRR